MELTEILKNFGEERFADHLARKIIEARSGQIISTTGDFKNAIMNAFPFSARDEKN